MISNENVFLEIHNVQFAENHDNSEKYYIFYNIKFYGICAIYIHKLETVYYICLLTLLSYK